MLNSWKVLWNRRRPELGYSAAAFTLGWLRLRLFEPVFFIWKQYILPSSNSYLSSSLSNLKVKELLCRKQIFVYGINHLMSRAESGAGSGISGSGAVQKIVSLAVFDCRWWKSTRRIRDVRTDWHDNPYI